MGAISLKCLEKDAALRYHSAEEFSDDLERALKGEPILARPSTATQRFHKWVRRNKATSALIATVVMAGFLLTVMSLSFNLRLTHARNKALSSEAEARGQLLSAHLRENARLNATGDALRGMFPLIEAARMFTNVTAVSRQIGERLSASVRFSPRLRRLWDAGGDPIQLQFSKDGKRLLAVLRSGEPRCWDLDTGRLNKHPDLAGRSYRASFISPDGSHVMEFFNETPCLQLWNVASGTSTVVPIKSDGGGMGAFSPDGKIVATAGYQVHLWDAETGQEKPVAITNGSRCLWLLFSPDGEQLITGHDDERAWRWNVHTGERLGEDPLRIWPGLIPRFSLDGKQLLVCATTTVQVLNWPSAVAKSIVPVGLLYDMNFSPAGRQFVIASFQDQARVWDVETARPSGLAIVHETGANKAVFSPDGALLATAGFDYQLRVVLASNHWPLFSAIHCSSLIDAVTFSPDSRFLAIGDVDGVVQVWDMQSAAQPFFPDGHAVNPIKMNADGEFTVVEDSGALRVFDLSSGAEIDRSWDAPPAITRIAIAPAKHYIAGVSSSNTACVWDFSTRKIIREITPSENPATRNVMNIIFNSDESELLTITTNGLMQRWSLASGEPVGPPMNHGGAPQSLRWSGDGRWILAAGHSVVTVWDAQTSLPLGAPIHCGNRERISEARFSPDSALLLVAAGNESIEPASAQLYELPSLRTAGPPLRHGDGVATARFSPDGKWVATGGEDNVARVWRVADGKPITGMLRHDGIVNSVLFSPGGRILATGCVDGNIRLWDVERGELIGPPIQIRASADPLCFTSDGQKLFVLADDSKRTVWSISLSPSEMPLEKLATLAECRTGLRADRSQSATPLNPAELAARFSALPNGQAPLVTTQDSRRWHSERAIVAEIQGSWFTAAFHLERLLASSPNDAALKERLDKARKELSSQSGR